jgi:integrase/recombinase XerD
MDNNKISVIEKGNKKRDIFFGNNTKESLKTWMEDRKNIIGNNTGALFISKNKTRMSRNAVSDMLKNATKEAKINKHITLHKMGSTFGRNFYEQTKDIYLTQNMMGHSNIKNTMIYVKATEEQERKAANVFDSLY